MLLILRTVKKKKNTKFIYIHGLPEKINEILYETKKNLIFQEKIEFQFEVARV